jgi:hypothetical protein
MVVQDLLVAWMLLIEETGGENREFGANEAKDAQNTLTLRVFSISPSPCGACGLQVVLWPWRRLWSRHLRIHW